MSDAARESVEKLVAAGAWPDPALLEEILAHGEAAIEPLRAVLKKCLEPDEDNTATEYVVWLLGSLGARSALPEMLEIFRTCSDDRLDVAERVVGSFGHEVIESLIPIILDPKLDTYGRASAATAARQAAGGDLVHRQKVAECLRQALTDCMAPDVGDDGDTTLASFLVVELAQLADPLARELIQRAFDSGHVYEDIIALKDVEASYERGGADLDSSDLGTWIDEYREAHAEQREWERRSAEYASFPVRSYDRVEPVEPEDFTPRPLVETIRHQRSRPGRNDPCWCGSGKKYKKCHLPLDDAASRG